MHRCSCFVCKRRTTNVSDDDDDDDDDDPFAVLTQQLELMYSALKMLMNRSGMP